ncbi:MAG TPA: tyrosine-type recombinase/integrase [Streptosporangiaceae bacterium]|nr:tyrosine-type recombinase/integrase [Streptosporangiaceae bacterium]
MDDGTTFDARVYQTEIYKGSEVTTYKVRWKVGSRLWKEGFRTVAQADSFRSALLTAARRGEAFSLATGRPVVWERAKLETSWYEFACAYADLKWKQASAKYRKDIARALTAATPGMLAETRGRPDDGSIRRALIRWGFNTKQRSEPPDEVAEVLTWVARNSGPVSALAEAANARRMLDQATGRLDGKNAAASTARRHRTILANAMDYAVELGLLETNPIRALKWTAPKVSSQVDRRSVVNPRQARALLEAVRAQQPSGPRLVTFFAVMYYAGLRPEEATSLAADNVILPRLGRPEDEDWGELHIRSATPDAGSEWTDDGSARERRQLKHRAEGDSRIVPTHPELTRLLRDHLAKLDPAPDGRVFSGVRGGELPTITYRRAWAKARQVTLTAAEQASPLARRPYDLRHACLSTWLNGGVYPTQVAEWAGHSVDVLLRIYAKCVVGQDELAKRRISEALRQD